MVQKEPLCVFCGMTLPEKSKKTNMHHLYGRKNDPETTRVHIKCHRRFHKYCDLLMKLERTPMNSITHGKINEDVWKVFVEYLKTIHDVEEVTIAEFREKLME